MYNILQPHIFLHPNILPITALKQPQSMLYEGERRMHIRPKQ
jgi:hypothetical protein